MQGVIVVFCQKSYFIVILMAFMFCVIINAGDFMREFIDLNQLFSTDLYGSEDLLQAGKLNRIFNASHCMYTFVWNGTKYYFKEMPMRELVNELVAIEIGKLVDISVLDLDVATFQQAYGTLSEDFQQPGDQKVSLPDVMQEYAVSSMDDDDTLLDFFTVKSLNNLEDIWFALEEKYQDTAMVSTTMNSLVDIFCFDMLTGQSDRHLGNIELLENENSIRLAPCYDNSSIYGGNRSLLGVDFNDFGTSSEEEKLTKFLTISSQEFVDRFFTMQKKLKDVGMDAILTSVTEEYGIPIYPDIKNDLIHGYQRQMNLIDTCKHNLAASNKIK